MLAIDTIVVPQGAEHQAVDLGLQQAKVTNIQVVTIPIGSKNIQQIIASYPQQLDNAQQILMIGLCGSLSKSYRVGDKILIQSCQDVNRNQVNLDPNLTARIQNKLSLNLVTAFTSDLVISQAKEKYELAQQYQSQVVEMEGYGYVKELQRQGKFVAMLRVVSDDLTADIPNLNHTIDSQGNIKILAMAISLLKQPLAALRLIKSSLTALRALKQVTIELFT